MQLIISSINHNVQKKENYDNYRYCQLEGKKTNFHIQRVILIYHKLCLTETITDSAEVSTEAQM